MAGKELRFGLLMTVIDRATGPLAAVGGAFARVGQAGRALSDIGAGLRIARENVQDFAQRGAQGLRDLIQPTQDIEQALLDLKPVVANWGADTSAILAQVQHDAIEHSRATGQAATEYIAAYTRMAQAGHGAEGSAYAAHLALQVASGTKRSAADAAAILSLTYEQLGDRTKNWEQETETLADQLVRTRQIYGSFDVSTMRDVAKDAAQTARDAGVPTHQLLGLVGALQDAGVQGGASAASAKTIIESIQSAATQVGFALERTSDGGLDLQATLKGIREQYGSLNEMSVYTRTAFAEALGPAWQHTAMLIDQADRLGEQWEQLEAPVGAAATAHREATSTSAAELARLNAEWTATKLELAQGVLPAIRELAPQFRELLKPIVEIVRSNPELVAHLGTWGVMAVMAANVAAPVLSAASAAASLGGQVFEAAGRVGEFAKNLRGADGHIVRLATTSSRAGSAVASAGRAVGGWGAAAGRGAVQLARLSAQGAVYVGRTAVSFVAASARMAASLFTSLFPATSAAIANIARLVAAKAAYAARATASFVAATGRSAAALSGRLLASTTGAAASVWRLIAAKGAYAGRAVASFVASTLRAAAAVTGPYVAAMGRGVLALGRLIAQGALYALRGADRFIAATLRMGASLIGSLVPSLAAGAVAAGKFALVLMANPITWIVAAIVAAAALIYVYWDPITEFFGQVWEGIKSAWSSVTSFFAGIWADVKAAFDEGFVAGILKVIELFSPVVWIARGLDAVTEYLFGFSLFDAGSNIVTTVWNGIKSMAHKPVEAMRDMAGKIRNLLPFSPAKDGPLRDLNRVRLVETLAETVNPAPLVDAMTAVASDAIGALTAQALPVPQFAAMPAGLGFAAGAQVSSGPSPVQVTFQLQGGADVVAQLEAWIRDPSNARRLNGAIQQYADRQRRAEF